jgi:taurine--2-oxoglutarate transaminase
VSGESRRWAVEPGIPGVLFAPAPYCFRCDLGHEPKTCGARCAQYIETMIQYEGPDNVAAVIVEGIIGANGVLLPQRDDYLTTIREICDKYGVLMIVDEIMSGFGRAGEWFAVNRWGVVPDIITLAKGLTGCHIPMGATVVSDKIAERLDAETPLMVGLTYSGNPLAAAAAIAAINVYRDEHLIENARALGQRIADRVPGMIERHVSIGDIRGTGLFWFVELVQNRATKQQFGLSNMRTIAGKGLVQDVVNEAAKRGVHIMGHPLGFMVAPPLCISAEDLDRGLDAIEDVLAAVTDPACDTSAGATA